MITPLVIMLALTIGIDQVSRGASAEEDVIHIYVSEGSMSEPYFLFYADSEGTTEISEIDIDKKDIREDTFRASGAGGQHVNKTDSAIRLTHIPSGTVVECQDERSQHKNRARALSLLQAKLLDSARSQQQMEQAENRKTLVGSGDRSERIRTYNFPQGRITDHRINLTLYKLEEVIEGDLDALVEPLIQEHQADQLKSLSEN